MIIKLQITIWNNLSLSLGCFHGILLVGKVADAPLLLFQGFNILNNLLNLLFQLYFPNQGIDITYFSDTLFT